MKHQNETVQSAATVAMSAISELMNCTQEVQAFVKDFQTKNANPTTQCSVSRTLGALAYEKFGHGLAGAIGCLISGLTKDVSDNIRYENPNLYLKHRVRPIARWSKPGAIASHHYPKLLFA